MFSYITILDQIAYRKKTPMKMHIPVDRDFFRIFTILLNCVKNFHDKCTTNVPWNFDFKNDKKENMHKITSQPMLGWIFQYALQLKVIDLTTQEHNTSVGIVGW